jgi:hypothetical protein
MKTKNLFKFVIIAVIAIGTFQTSCKKDKKLTAKDSVDLKKFVIKGGLQRRVELRTNDVLDDAIEALVSSNVQSLALVSSTPIYNATIDASKKRKGLYKITYSGTTKDGSISRTGVVKIQLDTTSGGLVKDWTLSGATMFITFSNYVASSLISDGTNTSTSKISMTGTHTITSMSTSGFYLSDPTSQVPSLVFKVVGQLSLQFLVKDYNSSDTWNVARTRTLTLANSITTETLSGDTTVNNYSNVSFWGSDFYVRTTSPVVKKSPSTCLAKGPIAGVRVIDSENFEFTITYGVNASGTPIASGECPYGKVLSYVINGVNQTQVVPYQ